MAYLANVVSVGGNGGYPFDFNGIGNGATLKKMQVWVGGSQIKAIKAWLTDDQSMQFGELIGDYSEFIFEDGERFTSLSLWDNGEGNCVGAIKFKTDRSREFYVKIKDRELKKECPVDVGSGICVGLTGRSAGEIDKLGFKFINTIKSTKLTNVQYPTLNSVKPNVALNEIKSMTYKNDTNRFQENKLEATIKKVQKAFWSLGNKYEIIFDMEVKAGIPGIVPVSDGFILKVGPESFYGLQNNRDKIELFSLSVRIPPGKTMDVNIIGGWAAINLPFNGKIQVTCYNGGVLEFPTTGIYNGIVYTDVKGAAKESAKTL